MRQSKISLFKKVTVVTSCTAFLLSGCVTTQEQRIGADDGTDVCRPYVVALDATGDYFEEEMVKGALFGALAGGILGAVAAGGDDVGTKALIGAAAGAALGAGGGYIAAKMQQEADKAVLYQTVLSDYEREVAKIDEAQFALDRLTDCRRNAFLQVRADYASKRISRDAAKLRWEHLIRHQSNDVRIAEAMGQRMTERMAEFESANTAMASLPWDAAEKKELSKKAQQIFERDQKLLVAQHKEERARLDAEIAAEKSKISGKSAKKAEVAKQKKALDAKKAKLAKELAEKQKKQRQQFDEQKVMAAAVPTTTGQIKIQKYQASVQQIASATQSMSPDGFETSRLLRNGSQFAFRPVLYVSAA